MSSHSLLAALAIIATGCAGATVPRTVVGPFTGGPQATWSRVGQATRAAGFFHVEGDYHDGEVRFRPRLREGEARGRYYWHNSIRLELFQGWIRVRPVNERIDPEATEARIHPRFYVEVRDLILALEAARDAPVTSDGSDDAASDDDFHWAAPTGARPEGVLNPRVVRGTDGGLLGAGALSLTAGGVSFGVAFALAAGGGGPLDELEVPYTLVAYGAATTLVGAIVLGIALTSPTEGLAAVELVPAAPGADAGASARLRFE